jgi:hypothetical protein
MGEARLASLVGILEKVYLKDRDVGRRITLRWKVGE